MRDRLIHCLLALYPSAWRKRYGKEFEALLEDEPLGAGLLLDVATHCLRQRLSPEAPMERRHHSPSRAFLSFRLPPEPRFRFPYAIIFLMTVTFGGVVVAIRIASRAAGDTSGEAWTTLGSVLFFMLLTMCVVAAIMQGILRCLRRSGVHRLENIQSHICSEESNRRS
jgi:hypothetical protein